MLTCTALSGAEKQADAGQLTMTRYRVEAAGKDGARDVTIKANNDQK